MLAICSEFSIWQYFNEDNSSMLSDPDLFSKTKFPLIRHEISAKIGIGLEF